MNVNDNDHAERISGLTIEENLKAHNAVYALNTLVRIVGSVYYDSMLRTCAKG